MNESSNKLFMAKPPDQKNTSERKIYCPWPYRCNNDLKITHTYFMCLILNTYLQCVHIKLYIFSATESFLSANATKTNDFGYNWSQNTNQTTIISNRPHEKSIIIRYELHLRDTFLALVYYMVGYIGAGIVPRIYSYIII